MTPTPGLYVGTLRHRRAAPRVHEFRYSLFMVLLDIDRLPEAMAVSWLTSYNRLNWASFDERDHLGDPSRPLRQRLRESAAGDGVTLPDGPIFLLTHLRYAGYVFNPLSLFYCYDAAGTLQMVLAEVSNTYGGRHAYWLVREQTPAAASFRARSRKVLYVSPFMPIDMEYEFALTPPGAALVAHMTVRHGGEPSDGPGMFAATLSLRRRPWSAASIRSALLRFPFMTAAVIAAIHWQALRLWLKGVPVIPRRTRTGVGERAAAPPPALTAKGFR